MDPQPEWKPLLKEVLNIQEEIYTPGAMASGQKSLAHKCEVMAHQWHISIPPDVPLQEHADSYQFHCSDMGTEMTTSEFVVPSFENLLPPWVNRCQLRADLDVDNDLPEVLADIAEAADLSADTIQENVDLPGGKKPYTDAGKFLRSAQPIYGMQHCCNNICADVHLQLVWWPTFWPLLKDLERLLLSPARRTRFVFTCMVGALQFLELEWKPFLIVSGSLGSVSRPLTFL